jgi:antitoxin component of RelBE/YafQ-DinJ toxin-antitoxin module
MSTFTIKLNERSKFGKALLAMLELGIEENKVEVIRVPNAETLKAIEDAEKGKTTKVKNSKELFKNLGI